MIIKANETDIRANANKARKFHTTLRVHDNHRGYNDYINRNGYRTVKASAKSALIR